MKRVVFSSVQMFAQTLKTNPRLFEVGVFGPLRPLVDGLGTKPRPGCNCAAPDVAAYKRHFESALTALSSADRDKIKEVLKADRICYYVRSQKTGGLEMTCF